MSRGEIPTPHREIEFDYRDREFYETVMTDTQHRPLPGVDHQVSRPSPHNFRERQADVLFVATLAAVGSVALCAGVVAYQAIKWGGKHVR